jgi:hypothetical protein
MLLEGLGKLGARGSEREKGKKKRESIDLIGNRTRKLPICSIVPQPTTLLRVPSHEWK